MTVIITGAANGIGKAIALQCLEYGHHPIACDIDQKGLNDLQAIGIQTHQLDVTKRKDVALFFAGLKPIQESMALINNAGIYLGQSILQYSEEDLDRVVNVNIKGAVYCSQLFAQFIMAHDLQGRIVNISSVSGQEGSSDAIYGLSKAALLGLTKSCAMNFAPHILVNAVAPTMVNTQMMEAIPQWRKEEYYQHHLIPQPLLPDDIAKTVMFLLSDAGRHYSGATFDLNNGGYLR